MKAIRKVGLQLFAILCILCITSTAWADALVIPSGVQIIEEEAFSGSGASTLVIPESTSSIESKAFASCDELTDVYLPERTVAIAEDAFDSPNELTFHVYMGSSNANWALDHGYPVAYMTADDLDYGGWTKVESLVQTEATSTSSNELYYTHRLIVRLNSGYSMPNVSNFKQDGEEDPVVIPLEQDYYVIQFSNPTSARNCAAALNAWSEGCRYAEADYFISESTTTPNSRSALRSAASNDYMGFQAYSAYLADKIGDARVTVAVIDTGVNNSQVGCTVSADMSYDLVNGRKANDGFEDSHGTNVANQICNAFGELASGHLTIISYRVVRPSDARASYLLVGKAIRRAKDDGANFVNISHVFESAYIKDQDNMFLRESISYFGAGRIYAAAGNNAAMSASSALPARYCVSVTGAQYADDGETLVRAPGTATGANYAGYDTTTSYATAKVVAAAALTYLDPDPTHTLDNACVFVTSDCGKGMPDLSKYPFTPVAQIILNNGDPIESILEIGDRASIDYEVLPDDATISTVTVTSSNSSIVEVLSNTGVRVRILAKGKGTATLTFTADDGSVDPIVVPITVNKPVTSVAVTGDTGETLMKGETLPLTATVLPTDATDTSVTWFSSNDSIATVSETGVVSQVGAGSVTITATSNYDQTIWDSVTLEVSDIPDVTGVTVSAQKLTIGIGVSAGTLQMNATVSPADADQTVTWSVDRPEVAIVSETGLLTAIGDGEVIVTATSTSSGKSGYIGITVVQLPTAITASGSDTVNVGETMQLTATVTPENARDKSVVWSSSKTTVATVDADTGLVTGVSEGTAVIIARCNADSSVADYYAISVTVLPDSVTIDAPSTTTLDIGETLALSATVNPSNTSNKTVTWSTSDSSIATVSSGGVVTAKAPGNVSITARTINAKTDSITLTVRQPYTLSFDANGGSCDTSSWTCYSGYAIGGTLPTASRPGYTFVGWFTAASGGSQVTTATSFTSSSTVPIYAHWTANQYTVYFNENGGVSPTPTSKSVTYGSTYGTLATVSRTGYTFAGWYTVDGTQITSSTTVSITSDQTLYAHWTANDYSYNIVYQSSNGTNLGSSTVTKEFDTTNTITPPAYAGYTTPEAQDVTWDSISKTITFAYAPVAVDYFTKSQQWNSSPVQTFNATVEYQNRTADSVQIRIIWTNTIKSGYTIYGQKFYGSCGGVSIPKTKVVSFNDWKNSSSSPRSKTGTSSWITIPLNTTAATTLSLSIKYHQYNSNDTDVSTLSSVNATKYEATWTINIPAY